MGIYRLAVGVPNTLQEVERALAITCRSFKHVKRLAF